MVVRGDLAASFIIRRGIPLYERLLDGYWSLVKRTVLSR
jgi:hypothetical protein